MNVNIHTQAVCALYSPANCYKILNTQHYQGHKLFYDRYGGIALSMLMSKALTTVSRLYRCISLYTYIR